MIPRVLTVLRKCQDNVKIFNGNRNLMSDKKKKYHSNENIKQVITKKKNDNNNFK